MRLFKAAFFFVILPALPLSNLHAQCLQEELEYMSECVLDFSLTECLQDVPECSSSDVFSYLAGQSFAENLDKVCCEKKTKGLMQACFSQAAASLKAKNNKILFPSSVKSSLLLSIKERLGEIKSDGECFQEEDEDEDSDDEDEEDDDF